MTGKQETPVANPAAIVRPDALKKIMKESESALLRDMFEADRKAEEEKKGLREAFMSRTVREDAIERVNAAVQRAAEARKEEVELFRFPASFCNDGGRRINNNEPDWPVSLEGFAKHAYDVYVEQYKPLGYKLKAQVMDFPHGMPGDVALFLAW